MPSEKGGRAFFRPLHPDLFLPLLLRPVFLRFPLRLDITFLALPLLSLSCPAAVFDRRRRRVGNRFVWREGKIR